MHIAYDFILCTLHFILCIKYYNAGTNKKCKTRQWTPLRPKRCRRLIRVGAWCGRMPRIGSPPPLRISAFEPTQRARRWTQWSRQIRWWQTRNVRNGFHQLAPERKCRTAACQCMQTRNCANAHLRWRRHFLHVGIRTCTWPPPWPPLNRSRPCGFCKWFGLCWLPSAFYNCATQSQWRPRKMRSWLPTTRWSDSSFPLCYVCWMFVLCCVVLCEWTTDYILYPI